MADVQSGCPAISESSGAATGPVAPTGPRCQHLRLLKLQAEPVNMGDACRVQAAVSDLLSFLSDHDPGQHCTLPDLRNLRLTHPANWHDHAKGLCELAGTSLASAKPGEEEILIQDASRVDLEDRWAVARSRLHCFPRNLNPGRVTANIDWMDAPSTCVSGNCSRTRVHEGAEVPVVVQIAVHTPDSNFLRSQAILLASHHTLADLSSAIVCLNDKYAAQQLGAAPSGCYMLLNDTLYVAGGDEGAQAYTAPILSFLEERHKNVDQRITRYLQHKGLAVGGGLQIPHSLPGVRRMADVQLRDLQLTPGQHGRYMYAHCGACEHMLVVEDVRIQHALDPNLRGAPVTLEQHATPLHRCCICSVRPSTKIAYGDALAPSSPAFFCECCYDDLHIGADGQPVLVQPEMDVFDVEV